MMNYTLKKIIVVFILSALSVGTLWAGVGAGAGADGWMTDFEAAKGKAKREGKDLLINFSGSDWCGWCMKLKKEVFDQDKFQSSVPKGFVLVGLDFPRKFELPEALVKQNAALREKFSVAGFPAIILCDAEGRPYAKTGYQPGDAKEYIAHLEKLRKQKVQRDAEFARARQLKGPAKARALELGLSVVPPKCLMFYKKELDQIAEADPDDTSGFTAKVKAEDAAKVLRVLIHPLFKDRDFAAVPTKIDEFIAARKPTGEALQIALLYKLQAFYMEKKYDEVTKLAEEILKINDTNRPARFCNMIKQRMARLKKSDEK